MGDRQFEYLGQTFIPYGNIIGKDNDTRFHRLMYRTDTLNPLLKKADGYDYNEFYRAAGEVAAADIFYHPDSKRYYVPTGSGICCIDVREQRRYIKLLAKTTD
jgi:hypothetical protein